MLTSSIHIERLLSLREASVAEGAGAFSITYAPSAVHAVAYDVLRNYIHMHMLQQACVNVLLCDAYLLESCWLCSLLLPACSI